MGGKSELDDNVSFTGSADRRNTEASTNSSEGIQLICQSSIGRADQDKRLDEVLKSESSSSNSSLAIAPNQSEIKKQPEISVEIKPFGGQASSDTSQLTEQLCSQKTKRAESVVSSEAGDEYKEADHQQSPKLGANCEQGPNLCGFDLNEDLEMNEEPVSSYPVADAAEPIAVVAKIGVPNGLPFALPQFDGGTGWRSAPTSAFRPTLTSRNVANSNANPSPRLRDFDLNIAASVDGSDLEESGKLSLNLSCRGENLITQPKARNQGFDLNDKLLIDQDQSKQLEKASARQSNLQGARPAYWVDLGSMPAFTHVQGHPFIFTAPMFPSAESKQTHVPIQPTMALPKPPPGYYIGPANGLPYSQSFLPNPGFQYGLSGAPSSQIPGSLLAAAYPGGLNHLQTATGQGGFAGMRPGLLLNGGEVSANGSQTAAFPGLAYKRREPEGGWDCCQVNQRRAGAWK